MSNQFNRECSACGHRQTVTIRADLADALADFRDERGTPGPCPVCGDVGVDLVVRDLYGRVVRTSNPLFDDPAARAAAR